MRFTEDDSMAGVWGGGDGKGGRRGGGKKGTSANPGSALTRAQHHPHSQWVGEQWRGWPMTAAGRATARRPQCWAPAASSH